MHLFEKKCVSRICEFECNFKKSLATVCTQKLTDIHTNSLDW